MIASYTTWAAAMYHDIRYIAILFIAIRDISRHIAIQMCTGIDGVAREYTRSNSADAISTIHMHTDTVAQCVLCMHAAAKSNHVSLH